MNEDALVLLNRIQFAHKCYLEALNKGCADWFVEHLYEEYCELQAKLVSNED